MSSLLTACMRAFCAETSLPNDSMQPCLSKLRFCLVYKLYNYSDSKYIYICATFNDCFLGSERKPCGGNKGGVWQVHWWWDSPVARGPVATLHHTVFIHGVFHLPHYENCIETDITFLNLLLFLWSSQNAQTSSGEITFFASTKPADNKLTHRKPLYKKFDGLIYIVVVMRHNNYDENDYTTIPDGKPSTILKLQAHSNETTKSFPVH